MTFSTDKRQIFAENWLLRHLGDAAANTLAHYTRVEEYPAEAEIFRQGDPGNYMMAVLSGRLKMTIRAPDGKEIVLGFIGAGEIFGEMALLTSGNRSADATTLEPSSLLVIERRDFLPILQHDANLCIELLGIVCRRLQKTDQQIVETLFLDRSAKIANALLRLVGDYGRQIPEGVRIELKLSQSELGNLVGLTRESINKQIAEWRELGIISTADGMITIVDDDALRGLGEEI